MPEPLLALLKLLALALLYLFFFRVLRAVWAEVNPKLAATAPAEAPARPRGGPPEQRRRRAGHAQRLVMVEPKERRGHSWDLADEVTLGRAAGCQVTLDDSYVSQLHARVFRRDGVTYVEDLGSTNGTFVNSRPVSAPTPLRKGDKVKVGSTVMEVAG